MARHGYGDDDFDIVDADGWNQYDSYAMRRAPRQSSSHMTQQMTTKVAPAYDGRTSFFAFEDAIDDWCDITELEPLEPEKRGPALRNKLEGEADREMLRDPNHGVNYFKRFFRPSFHQRCPERVLIPFHAVHGVQQRNHGSSKMDD